jgi:hypothetical protein
LLLNKVVDDTGPAPGGNLGHFLINIRKRVKTGPKETKRASKIVYKRRSASGPARDMGEFLQFSGPGQPSQTLRHALWKLPQLWKSAKEACGNILLMISTSCLEKPSQKTLRLSHSSHSADD